MPIVSYRMLPGSIIKGAVRNLGVKFETRRYNNSEKALAELTTLIDAGEIVGLQTSVYWLPYFPAEMRFQFNAHNLIVYGREGDEFLISDPVFDHVVRAKAPDLQNARFAKGALAPEGFLYYPVKVDPAVDVAAAIRKSIKRTVQMMLYAPVPFIGIKGINTLAKKIAKLKACDDQRYIRLFLGHIVRMQEEIGTGGGGFRFMYAAFLQEAQQILNEAKLGDASVMMTEAGDMWRQFASACARICKSKSEDYDLDNIVLLIGKCAEQEKKVYTFLKQL
jgi:hypothetical protein